MEQATDCLYCNSDLERERLMLPVAALDASRLYLMRDQHHRGRCVLALDTHRTELFHLDSGRLSSFMHDVSRTAEAIARLYGADKINYAIYGDRVSHLHIHIVPKCRDRREWGEPFVCINPDPLLLPVAEYETMIAELKVALKRGAG